MARGANGPGVRGIPIIWISVSLNSTLPRAAATARAPSSCAEAATIRTAFPAIVIVVLISTVIGRNEVGVILGVGFAAYALWRLSEAAFGVTGDPNGAGPRLKSLGRAVIYAGFAYLTFTVISGRRASQSRQQQDLTARAMQHSGGQWLVGIVGLVVVIIGVVLVSEGIRRKFMQYLRTSQMGPRMRRVVTLLGVIGTVARGLVFGLAGVLVIDAAASHKPAQSGGIDKALLTLRDQPFGETLMILAALGLLIFGVYGLCEARWRNV